GSLPKRGVRTEGGGTRRGGDNHRRSGVAPLAGRAPVVQGGLIMRRLPTLLTGVVALCLAVACAPPGGPGGSAQNPTGPIKVGFLAPLTGTAAASGADMVNGWNLYWKLNGNTVQGHEIQTTNEDTAGDPNTALTKARQFVEQQQVDMIVGP